MEPVPRGCCPILCSSPSLELKVPHKNLSPHHARACLAPLPERDVVPGAGIRVSCQGPGGAGYAGAGSCS